MRFLDFNPIFLLVCGLVIDFATSQLAAANSVAQQQANASLPGLSERANGLNSRYLSAGSTASLAAATVAASNQAPQQQQHQSQAHQQHQNQHPQPQQQLASPTNSLQQSQLPPPPPSPQQQQLSPAQYSTAAAPQALATAQNLAGQLGGGPPVMSSTYAFNPLTGQYGPAESLSPGLQQQQQQQNHFFSQQPFVSQQLNGQAFLLQQQQQQQQPSPFLQPPARSPQRFIGSNQGYFPASGGSSYFFPQQQQQQQQPQQQIFGRYPQQQSGFTRRVGQQALGIGSRNTNYLLGGGVGGSSQLIDDDSNGLFQQQQVSSASLADQLAASLGLNLDPSYVATSQQSGGGFSGFSGFSNGGGGGGGGPSAAFLNGDNQQAGFLQQQPSNVAGSLAGGSGAANNPLLATDHRSDQCVAADGRHGTCYQASECIRRGGTPMGRCGASSQSSSNNGGGGGGGGGGFTTPSELSGTSHVCCLFDVTCGQFAAERFVYFRNPNYPNSYDQSRMCRAKIGKLDKGVCQFRLDLTRFDIAKPTNGNCSQDMFVVSGQNENYVIPKICGLNDGQHYYVGVDESGVITLHMMMMGYHRRSFEVLVTQIPCRSDFAAPAHCLQYFMGTHGTIKSFNYDDDTTTTFPAAYQAGNQNQAGTGAFVNYDLQQEGSGSAPAPYGLQFAASQQQQQLQQRQQPGPNRYGLANEFGNAPGHAQFGGYPNDLDYTICIRKESGFCSITYQLSRTDQGLAPFAVGQPAGNHFGQANETALLHASGWSSVSSECRDDYLLIGGVRLCSGNAGAGQSSPYYEQTVQFGGQQQQLNGSNVYASQQLQQQLQNQQNSLMQQLARLQQQAALAAAGNSTSSPSAVGLNLPNQQQQQQASQGAGSGNNNFANNLEQQQAAIVQQIMFTQQQLNSLLASGQQQPFAGRPFNQEGQYSQVGGSSATANDLQGAIITDTTSGPFLLRFVSNMARNARGFHIDYRQNPCK